MTENQFVQDTNIQDDRYNCYHPIIPLQVFNSLVDSDDCEINISIEYDIIQILPIFNNYLEWLKHCKNEVVEYFSKKIDEKLPKEWFENIEVYNFSFTLNNLDDFGATVFFGESIFVDHIIELDFEKYEIVDDGLNG